MVNADAFALQTEYGSITGTFLVKERIGDAADDTTFSFKTNTDISLTAPADNTGGEVKKYVDAEASHYTITYTHTSGTAALKVGVQIYEKG
jgi:hypothetical protein